MYYKLSALELELLARDRNKILRQFQESQETRRRSLKPPILVVPNDSSGLICFITRDEEEGSFSSQESLAAAGDGQADAGGDGETGEKGLKSMSFAKLHQLCIRFGSFIKGKVTGSTSDPKAKIQDRNLKKHQKRLSSGAAVRYPGLSHALTGQLLGMTVNGKHFDPFFLDIGPLLGIKCDVCVLSEERQVFRLLDAILESNLWPLEATTTTKSRQQEEMDNNHSSRKNQKKEQLKTNQHLTHAQIAINGNPPLD